MTAEQFNIECVNRLRAANLSNRVAIVGAGPSCPLITSVDALREEFCKRCRVVDSDQDLWNLAEIAYTNEPIHYFDIIKKAFQDMPNWTADAYNHIVSIPFKGYVTFNYDDQLPKVFCGREGRNNFSVYPPANGKDYFTPGQFQGQKRRLIAIHGYSDPHNNPGWEEHVILKMSDYNNHYFTPPTLFRWWKDLLLVTPCIFIGTRLNEPGLYRVIQHLLLEDRHQLELQKHIHLMVRAPGAINYPPPSQGPSAIEQIYFDPNGKDFRGFLQILSEFSGIDISRPTPTIRAPEPLTLNDTLPPLSP